MTIAIPNPLEVARIVNRRHETEICWSQRYSKDSIFTEPIITPVRKKKRSKRRFLTKHEHAQLVAGELPKGVDWRTVKLTRRQKGLRKKARSMYVRRLERSQLALTG